MGIPGGANLLLAAGGVSTYEIDQSLRFSGGQYLSKTFSSSGNRETNTLSLWCKRSYLSAFSDNNYTLVTADPNNNYDEIGFTQNYGNTESDEVWYRIQGGYYVIPNNLFRDISAWTHLVFRRDGTQSTAANRLRIYINGAEATYRATNYQPQNQEWGKLCHSCNHRIGTYDNTYQKFRGYMAELHLVDGQSLGPDSFGEYDDNGVWRPIAYDGTYGTNGIYMKFDPSAANGIGHDHSGNGHHFTPTGFTTSGTGTDVMSDTPTTNWCTLNPLDKASAHTLSDGNLKITQGSTTDNNTASTIAVSSGKWYFELEITNHAGSISYDIGIGKDLSRNTVLGNNATSYAYSSSGNKRTNSTNSSYGASFTTGDILGAAFDADAGTLTFYKNGTSQGQAFTGITNGPYHFLVGTYVSGDVRTVNFGQRAFSYTPPTGYKALNTANLPTPDIADGSQYFNTVLWTGNAANPRSITGVGFSPDFVWTKKRSSAQDHFLFDVVRGSTNGNFYELRSNSQQSQGVPSTASTGLRSLDSDGFTIGSDASVNTNNDTYVAWNWQESATAGFNIVTWSGNDVNGRSIAHGLGLTPAFIIVKSYSSTQSWPVWHQSFSAIECMLLDGTTGKFSASAYFGGGANEQLPDDVNFYIGSNNDINGASRDYIAYVWAPVPGYSSFGSFVGNGSADGPFIYTGHRVGWLLYKRADSNASWAIYDSARDPYNVCTHDLYANLNNPEASFAAVDLLSNGFKIRTANGDVNQSGGAFIYAAFAEHPFGGSDVSPATAR